MLARLAELDVTVAAAYEKFDFGLVNSTLFNFCTNDLSAFYFDIRKDALLLRSRACRAPPRHPHGDRRNLSGALSPGSPPSSASPWKRPGPHGFPDDSVASE